MEKTRAVTLLLLCVAVALLTVVCKVTAALYFTLMSSLSWLVKTVIPTLTFILLKSWSEGETPCTELVILAQKKKFTYCNHLNHYLLQGVSFPPLHQTPSLKIADLQAHNVLHRDTRCELVDLLFSQSVSVLWHAQNRDASVHVVNCLITCYSFC